MVDCAVSNARVPLIEISLPTLIAFIRREISEGAAARDKRWTASVTDAGRPNTTAVLEIRYEAIPFASCTKPGGKVSCP